MPKNHKIKVLIVDDERLARTKLKSLLKNYNGIEIVGEAKNAMDGIDLINKLSPDVLFLDIQMPGLSGFDLLERVNFHGKVIFVTAFDDYAIRAFEINAIDYLLKPLNPERLDETIKRLYSEEEKTKPDIGILQYRDKVFLSSTNGYKFISLENLVKIEALGDYTKLFCKDGGIGLMLRTMKEWEKVLPENHFARIHRKWIINLNYIERIEKLDNYSLIAFLKDCDEGLQVSKKYRKMIKNNYN